MLPTGIHAIEYTPEHGRAQFNPGCACPGLVGFVAEGVAGFVVGPVVERVAGPAVGRVAGRAAGPDSVRSSRSRAPQR